MRLVVDDKSNGLRLDKFLTEYLSTFSRSQIQKLISTEQILVNDQPVSKHRFLKIGDKIEVNLKLKKENNTQLLKKITIIAQTSDYLVIDKPAGLLVHPLKNNSETTLITWLLKNFSEIAQVYDQQNKLGEKRPGIVHRLDRDVSGLMVIAKTQVMFNFLKQQFKERKIQKEYLALAHGEIELATGKINRPLVRSSKTGLMTARTDNNFSQAKPAITRFEVLQRFKNFTLLKLQLITGRTHQIRVHLRSIGHAIVGDTLYSTKDIRKKKKSLDLNRIFLWAVKLGFYDLQKEWQEFEIKYPTELQNILKQIK